MHIGDTKMIVNEYFSIDDVISFNVYPAALLETHLLE